MIAAVATLAALGALAGLGLGLAAARLRVQGNDVVDRIDALLPQAQCGQCGYPGCRPYAEAIADGRAAIDLCPPGGEATACGLARLLDREPAVPATAAPPAIAVIDEAACIGCALCLAACPVDAIVGAQRHMHTVIAAECTGCGLCLPPCPVDCIDLVSRQRPERS
jgi:electron transport complex protein RnfB